MARTIPIESEKDIEALAGRARHPVLLVVEPGDVQFCGQVVRGVFGYRMGIETARLRNVIRDFVEYESSQDRTPLVLMYKGLALPERDSGEASPDSPADWVVHSTDAASGRSILDGGCLCSRRRLEREGTAFRPFGRDVLGEPPDYRDLVNFSRTDGYGSEIVVASKQHGRFCSDTEPYEPGMRFYVTVESLRRLPGYTRFMGGHAVKEKVPLDRVEHRVITPADVPGRPEWTPRTFTEAANRAFREATPGQARHQSPSDPV